MSKTIIVIGKILVDSHLPNAKCFLIIGYEPGSEVLERSFQTSDQQKLCKSLNSGHCKAKRINTGRAKRHGEFHLPKLVILSNGTALLTGNNATLDAFACDHRGIGIVSK